MLILNPARLLGRWEYKKKKKSINPKLPKPAQIPVSIIELITGLYLKDFDFSWSKSGWDQTTCWKGSSFLLSTAWNFSSQLDSNFNPELCIQFNLKKENSVSTSVLYDKYQHFIWWTKKPRNNLLMGTCEKNNG